MYLDQTKQFEMYNLINQYLLLSKDGTIQNIHTNRIINQLYIQYIDKMINGIIFSGKYKFYKKGDTEELFQEARIATLVSINKKQLDLNRGNIFNFFTTVIIRNLQNYTTRTNKKHNPTNIHFDLFENVVDFSYQCHFDNEFIFEELEIILTNHFQGHDKYQELTNLFCLYLKNNKCGKFTKKAFAEFVNKNGFTTALVNTFFTHIRNAQHNNKDIYDFLNHVISDIMNETIQYNCNNQPTKTTEGDIHNEQ